MEQTGLTVARGSSHYRPEGKLTNHLVVLTGPVGVGKSTVALRLREWLHPRGMAVAVIDLDHVYGMARQRSGYDDPQVWRLALLGSAALADSFFREGIDVVVVEGGLFGEHEYSQLVNALTSHVRRTFVTLLAGAKTVLSRAQADPSPDRIGSRRPEVQALLYAEFEGVLPFLRERSIVLSAEETSPVVLAKTIGELIQPEVVT